ncbi:hypothetical protein PanWU01x14_295070 [Parasponia andersonii]|uniref:Uncharacterized protein n=1 Tax=Parasponia andersonii TaxID=3476 RepID=A0A2P5AVZ3_PARAD|nr:hypothetical protein PanWU01x14_295070 [Parasponia andersonii]
MGYLTNPTVNRHSKIGKESHANNKCLTTECTLLVVVFKSSIPMVCTSSPALKVALPAGAIGVQVSQWVGRGIPNVVWASTDNPRRIWVEIYSYSVVLRIAIVRREWI